MSSTSQTPAVRRITDCRGIKVALTIGAVETTQGDALAVKHMDRVLAGLRPYGAGDTGAITRLIEAAESWPPVGRPTPEELLARWARWHAFPERDVNVLPGPTGGIAAYSRASVSTEPSTRL